MNVIHDIFKSFFTRVYNIFVILQTKNCNQIAMIISSVHLARPTQNKCDTENREYNVQQLQNDHLPYNIAGIY
jgi:hypothetical protein